MSTPAQRSAPERIWLNLGAEEITYTEAMMGEVTWCEDQQGQWDIEYVRADLVIKELAKAAHVGELQQERIEALEAENENLHWRAGTDSELTERIEALEQRHTFSEEAIVALQDRNKALEQELAARTDNYDYWRQYAEALELRDREWQAMTGAPVPPPLPPEASRLAELEAENAVLLKTFSHYHRASGTPGDDACAECGLDLRNSIHLRASSGEKG